MTAIDLRPVRADDVPAVVALVKEVLAEFGLAFGAGSPTDANLLDLPGSYRDAGGEFWVAYRGDELIGTSGVYRLDDETYELRKMYLRASARGLRLGNRLLDEAVAWSRARGARRLVLDTVEQMTRAIEFYEAHGFVRDDTYIRGARCTRGYVRAL